MKKKWINLVIAGLCVTALTGCAPDAKEQKTEKRMQHAVTEEQQSAQARKKEAQEKLWSKGKEQIQASNMSAEKKDEMPKGYVRRDEVQMHHFMGKDLLIHIPENFYWYEEMDEDKDNYSVFVERGDGRETLFIGLCEKWADIDESFCDEELQVPYYAEGTESAVQTAEVEGRSVYYKMIDYNYVDGRGKHVEYETIKAVCEVDSDYFLQVETSGLSGEKADFEEIKELFTFEEVE
ncbi:MAG: hypothetical protein ACI4HI_12390 [Lachnospiraceae bacterium]